MKKYRLLMNGRNFLIEIDGKHAKHGFYQNIFVEAGSPEEAELIAVDRIRNNEDLKRAVQNLENDPPKIFFDEIYEIGSISELDRTLEDGRTFYREKRWWQIWK
jgi:hypothetical protein